MSHDVSVKIAARSDRPRYFECLTVPPPLISWVDAVPGIERTGEGHTYCAEGERAVGG